MKSVHRYPILPRREFLRLVGLLGGAAGLSAFLHACQRAGLLPSQEPTAAGGTDAPQPSPSEAAAAAHTETLPTMEKPAATPTASSTLSQPGASRIALVMTTDRVEGVRKAIDLLGTNPVAGLDVFLKPNFNSADPAPGSTHPAVLRSLVLKLKEMGAGKITLGDRSGMGDTRNVMKKLGVFELAEELGFDTVVLDELEADSKVGSFRFC